MSENGDLNLRKILEAERESLYRIPGVNGLAIGLKFVAGEIIREPTIQVFVDKKKHVTDIPSDQIIPSHIAGVQTDVIQAGPLELLLDADQCPEIDPDGGSYRPLVGGIQIESDGGSFKGSYSGKATLGCIVRTRGDSPKDMLVSNEHVLYAGTASGPSCSGCTAGSRVGQPTSKSDEKIGNVLRSKKTALVDGALASLSRGTQWKAEILDIGRIQGKATVTEAMLLARTTPYRVRKRGAKTQLTIGELVAVDAEGHAKQKFSSRKYKDSLLIVPKDFRDGNKCFASSGDSGAVAVNDANEIIGLLFGTREMTNGTAVFHAGVACPIEPVLDQLQVDLVHSQPAGHVFTVAESFAVDEYGNSSPAPSLMSVEEHEGLRESVQSDILVLSQIDRVC